ncbi:hypothetical protein SP90_11655 [Halodesulfovibrio spirochaetisodalis]|uniref:Uncharacterized protein n=2 Tax=Halodesulfovibrio spirochaetisodalis TaxID=1560234 RepID=A0A1B7XAZ7_9BACT|nr:hypothetical protein SP90_11655 [Halodesulfovibrio spirochaetisodalis]
MYIVHTHRAMWLYGRPQIEQDVQCTIKKTRPDILSACDGRLIFEQKKNRVEFERLLNIVAGMVK